MMLVYPENSQREESSLGNDNEELVAELDILREEIATLIKDLRELARQIRNGDWMSANEGIEIADAIEEIING